MEMDPQRMAIDTIDKNICLQAGAGTGKTYVLSNRFLSILEKGNLPLGNEVPSILSITFTNKAADEMKEKITSLIKEKRDENQGKWGGYVDQMHKCSINTIHGFCNEIISKYGMYIGLDPTFTLAETWESEELLDKAVNNTWIKHGYLFKEWVPKMGITGIDRWRSLLKETFVSVYRQAAENGPSLLTKTKNNWEEFVPSLAEIKELLDTIGNNASKSSKWNNVLNHDLFKLLKSGEITDSQISKLLTLIVENTGKIKKCQLEIDALMDIANKGLMTCEKEHEIDYEQIVLLLEEVDGEYKRLKSELNLLDFDDLENAGLQLLNHDEVRKYIQRDYSYVMVDECQDTNKRQRMIIEKICTEKSSLDRENLFVVGDPKQSIYKFRGADLDEFYKLRELIENSGGLVLTMTKSYRFGESVTEYVNTVFDSIWEDEYDCLISMQPELSKDNMQIIKVPNGKIATRFDYVAHHMLKLHEQGAKWDEMAILLRANGHSLKYEKTLRNWGIPCINEGGDDLFSRQEIIDIGLLIRTIVSFEDKIAVAGLMRGPIGGLEDRVVVSWLFENKEPTDEVQLFLLKDLLNAIEEIKEIGKDQGISKAVDFAYDRLGILELWAYQDNIKAVTNLNKLKSLILEWESEKHLTWESLSSLFIALRSKGIEEGDVHLPGEGAVSIMTIHKAKGLEFDYVYLPDLHRLSNNQSPVWIYNKHKGLAIKRKMLSPYYNMVKDWNQREELDEELRVLYVAMTRAKKRLILGTVMEDDKVSGTLLKLIESDLPEDIVEKPITIEVNNISVEKSNPIEVTKKIWEPQELKRVQSITAYQVFRACPRRYFHRYINNTPEESSTSQGTGHGAALGLLVHDFAQNYNDGDDIDTVLRTIASKHEIDMESGIAKKGLKMANALIKLLEPYEILSRERSFSLIRGDEKVIGTVDLVAIGPKGLTVMDYKTNYFSSLKEKSDLIDYYSHQLYFYAYAIGVKDANLQLMFLNDETIVDVPFNETILNDFLVKWDDYVNATSNCNEVDDFEKNCESSYCPYAYICNGE
ncbi:MAG: UvrD-helicase domain-containing protein [Tissierellia bacterium]|nr:UvrD-helicase domain-containing protein [Tissierellia bacterium]